MLTSADRLLQVLNGLLLARVVAALLVVEPTKLLENLGVVGVSVEDTAVGRLSRLKLRKMLDKGADLGGICNNLRPSAAHGRDRSGTRCPLQSEGEAAH